MMGCWLDVLAYIAIGLTVLAFSFIWYDQRKAIRKLEKENRNKI